MVINIDESLFLKDMEAFRQHLLPAINDERLASGLTVLTEQEATNYYLDLFNEYRNADQDGKPDQGNP